MDQKQIIHQAAINCIQIETDTLTGLYRSFDESYTSAIELIYHSKGRLVITGIGKSAIIGQKIVATLNSTGTPAMFMHAADAIHGDLGMIKDEDIILCISKSGETSEIKALVPLIKALGNKMIAMVSHKQSYLGIHADYILHTPIEREADPNNLAPTSSTIAQMAMGDALSVSLLALRGFTKADFAKFHPGGALGKQLYLKAGALSSMHPKPYVKVQDNLHQVIISISSNRLGATAVLDDNEKLVGIITDGDLRRMLEKNSNLSSIKAIDIMSSDPKSIDHEDLAINALELMRSLSITQLIVVNNNQYDGIVHLHDLIREGIVSN